MYFQDNPKVAQMVTLDWASLIILLKLRETIAIAQDRMSAYMDNTSFVSTNSH